MQLKDFIVQYLGANFLEKVKNLANKKGIVLWGSSNPKTHGHEHNINLEAIRHCGQPPCIDKGSFYVPDDLNQRCCLLPENARKDVWPLVDEVVYEINSIL